MDIKYVYAALRLLKEKTTKTDKDCNSFPLENVLLTFWCKKDDNTDNEISILYDNNNNNNRPNNNTIHIYYTVLPCIHEYKTA